MISEVFNGLLEAGTGGKKARRAAEVLPNCHTRFNESRRSLSLPDFGQRRSRVSLVSMPESTRGGRIDRGLAPSRVNHL